METFHFEKIELSYGGNTVLHDINLDIEPGDFVLVCGPTGSGKSTLLRFMSDTCGKRNAFAAQNPDNGLVRDRVGAELSFSPECEGLSQEFIETRVAECAGYFGISKWMDRELSSLSGGEKQLLNIASAFSADPEILFLDEPTAMLDPIMTDRLLDIVVRLNREYGITVVISEHKPDSLYDRADKIIMVKDKKAVCLDKKTMAQYLMGSKERELYLPYVTRALWNREEPVYTIAKGRRLVKKEPQSTPLSDRPVKDKNVSPVCAQIKNVSFAYEKNIPVLKDISLCIHEGEVLALLGENGCGKSTLAYILAGVKRPYSGTVKIAGKTVKKAGMDCGMLFQEVGVHFTEDEYDGRHPYDLSGGEKQKLALSLVLKKHPRLLILDEPGKGLDPYEKAALAGRVKELSEDGIAVLIITHDLDWAVTCCDRIALMHDGKIVKNTAAKEFCENNIFYTTQEYKLYGRWHNL